jgi:hypothetical protein
VGKRAAGGEVHTGVSETGVGAVGSEPKGQRKGNITGQMIAMFWIFLVSFSVRALILVLACATLREIPMISAMGVPQVA